MENYNYNRNDLLMNYWAYIFPKLNEKDVGKADRDYGLKVLYTPCIDFRENTVLMGTWNNLLGYMSDYLGYDINHDYMIYLGKDKEAK